MSALPPPPVPRRRPGIGGLLFLGFWIAAALALAAFLATNLSADLLVRFGPAYLSGLWTTVSLVAISFVCGIALSFPIAAARMAPGRFLGWPALGFVSFFRGTPLLAQLFLVYYGLGTFRPQLQEWGLWWFFAEPWYCAILTFSLNTAAYQSEILRGGILSVPRGQWEGGRSLGLPAPLIFSRIVLPQALIVSLRPYANEIILLIKASAIVTLITVFDLMGETRRAYARTFDFQTYLWAAILYLVLVEALRNATNFAEKRLTRHLVR